MSWLSVAIINNNNYFSAFLPQIYMRDDEMNDSLNFLYFQTWQNSDMLSGLLWLHCQQNPNDND